MLKKIFEPSFKKFIVSTILFILSMFFLLPLMTGIMESATGTTITPDSDFFYTPSRLKEIGNLFGAYGSSVYFKTRFTLDLIWPIVYLFFMVNSLGVLINKLNLGWSKSLFLSLPFIGVSLDLIENILCSIYMCISQNQIIAYAASISSAFKWLIMLSILFFLVLLSLVLILVSIFKKEKSYDSKF